MQAIELPDRQAITLCEAVTAFVYGKACDELQRRGLSLAGLGIGPGLTKVESAKAEELIERLQSAALAGQIKFRALKSSGSPADEHEDIDPLYFSQQRGFEWYCDKILSRDLSEPDTAEDWYDVHLDAEAFVSLLRDMDARDKRKIYHTGTIGRPSAMHLILPRARSRLAAGDYPKSRLEFSKQLADWLTEAEPEAPRMSQKAIYNNAELRGLWNRLVPKITDRS
jgi:hypothetical protein